MSLTIRKLRKRLRSKRQMAHKPSGVGKGRWHGRATLWLYKRKSRRLRKIAEASRYRNRAA